jgi:hypothetical protein
VSDPFSNPVSVLVLIVTIVVLGSILGFFLLMLERLRRRGDLQTGLIHIVFLPERRRNFLRLISLLAVFFILSGINTSLASVGFLDLLTQDVVSTVAYVGGAVCLFLLIYVALRPAEIEEHRRAELERSSQELIMLAFAPADAREAPPFRP